MGRGDKKTKRGKITQGSFGKTRASREIVRKTAVAATPATAKPVPEKKEEGAA